MDLNSSHLLRESVEDNACPVLVDYSKFVNNGSSGNVISTKDVSGNGSLPDDHHEKGFRSPEQVNIELERAVSPGGSWPSTKKGYGLKKWRRIKREGLMKDGTGNVDSKVLKRGLSGSVDPPSKPVNMANNLGMINRVSRDLDSGFVIGQAFPVVVELENSKEHNSKSSAMARARNIEARGDLVKTEWSNLCSSLDSDSRSSYFDFSNGAFSVADNGKQREGWKNHNGEHSYGGSESDRQQCNKEDKNGCRRENGEHETQDGIQDQHCSSEKDPLVDSVQNLVALQEALEKEVQDLREIGRESTLLHHDLEEPSSSNLSVAENSKENSSTSTESLELSLKQNIKLLESNLEEAKALLQSKDAKIQELENLKIEYELEGLFQRQMETEIEHLILTTSLKTHGVLEEQKRTQTTEISGSKQNLGDMSEKACKFGLCFLMQLILLVLVLRFFAMRFSPYSLAIVPT